MLELIVFGLVGGILSALDGWDLGLFFLMLGLLYYRMTRPVVVRHALSV